MAYRHTERVIKRRAARYNAILASARAVAAEAGMGMVQIVPVAERAGIAAGTVYRYFPKKVDLVRALVKATAEREIAAMRRAANSAPGPLSALAAALTMFAVRTLKQRRLARAMIAEPVDAEIDAVRLEYRRALADELEVRIRAACLNELVPDQDIGLAAAALVGILLETLFGPLVAVGDDVATVRNDVQMLTLTSLRALGIGDARARGLVVQCGWPAEETA
jgi:AcrR family transcriptional regulator